MNALELSINKKNKAIRSWKPLFNADKYTPSDMRRVVRLLLTDWALWEWDAPLVECDVWFIKGERNTVEVTTKELPACILSKYFESDAVYTATPEAIDELVRITRLLAKCDTTSKFKRLNKRLRNTTHYFRESRMDLESIVDGLTKEYTIDEWSDWVKCPPHESMQRDNNVVHMYTAGCAEGMVAYIGNGEDMNKRYITYSKYGRAVKKLQPSLTDDDVRIICNEALPAELEIYTSVEDVEHAYSCKEGRDWGSCMHKVEVGGYLAATVYAESSNAAVAVMKNKNGNLMARALVNTESMQFESIYGHHALRAKLIKMGYEESGHFTEGLEVKLIYVGDVDDKDQVLMPYLDGYADRFTIYNDDSKCILSSSGDHTSDGTDGYAYV